MFSRIWKCFFPKRLVCSESANISLAWIDKKKAPYLHTGFWLVPHNFWWSSIQSQPSGVRLICPGLFFFSFFFFTGRSVWFWADHHMGRIMNYRLRDESDNTVNFTKQPNCTCLWHFIILGGWIWSECSMIWVGIVKPLHLVI